MRVKGLYIAVLTALLVALAGCTPRATPVPTPTPVSPQAAPAKQAPVAPTAPAVSPEEAAWQKVVSEAQKEGKFTHYGAGIVGEAGTIISAAFQRRYGIKMELVTGIGAVHTERIKSEHRAGKSVADTFDTSLSTLVLAKEDGLTVSVGDLPVLREKDVWLMAPPIADPEGHILAYSIFISPVMINTTLVKPGEEPRSYRELLEPRWRGEQITMGSPVTSTNPIYIYLATKKAGTLDDDFWRRLGLKGIRIAPSSREPPSWLARGEVAVALDIGEATMAPFAKEGAPVKALEMVEGVTVHPVARAISLIKNGPHPNAARVFVNWLLSQEGQQLYTKAAGGVSAVRKDVPDVRPPTLRVEIKKPLLMDFPMTLEVAKIQREGTLVKLLGLER